MKGFFRRNIKRIGIGLIVMVAMLFSAQASAAQQTLGSTLTVAPATVTKGGNFTGNFTTPSFSPSYQHGECEFESDDG
jgi:hypothetical protein